MTKNENTVTNKSNYVTLTRRVGNTNYKVNIYFSETEKETMEEKIIRLVENERLLSEDTCGTMETPQMSRQSERSAS